MVVANRYLLDGITEFYIHKQSLIFCLDILHPVILRNLALLRGMFFNILHASLSHAISQECLSRNPEKFALECCFTTMQVFLIA